MQRPLIERVPRRGTEIVDDVRSDGAVERVVEVRDPNALTQAIGYLKFAADRGSMILFRGQSRIYPNQLPTGYRSGLNPSGRANYHAAMARYADALYHGRCPCDSAGGKPSCEPNWPCQEIASFTGRADVKGVVSGTPRVAAEPLLQHYGLRTRWLDVVDNVWIALWFACHRFEVMGRYAHHVRRSEAQEPDGFAYLQIVSAGAVESTAVPGVYRSDRARVVDLRYAVPSVYIRPHAQHGVLIAAPSWDANADPDLSGLTVLTMRIRLQDALSWLGEGDMLSAHVLFPPATYDTGYRRLLDGLQPPSELGEFLLIGPGI